jgi:hypothetical protein
MAKKSGTIVQVKLRIREHLRRRLEVAAKKRGVAVNYEMMSRLERSFELESIHALEGIANEMQLNWLRFAERFMGLQFNADILAALATNPDQRVAKNLALAWVQMQMNTANLAARLRKEGEEIASRGNRHTPSTTEGDVRS